MIYGKNLCVPSRRDRQREGLNLSTSPRRVWAVRA